MSWLEVIENLRIKYYEIYNQVPEKVYMDIKIFNDLKKELIYSAFGYHRLLYYKDSISILGMEIIISNGILRVD